jgi:hypothetical protein
MSWWAREDPGRDRTRKSMKTKHVMKCLQIQKVTKTNQHHIFLDENGSIPNEKMMPDVTITVPELEIDKKHIGNQYFYEETSGPCTHKPSHSLSFSKKLSGASPYIKLSSETSLLWYITRYYYYFVRSK